MPRARPICSPTIGSAMGGIPTTTIAFQAALSPLGICRSWRPMAFLMHHAFRGHLAAMFRNPRPWKQCRKRFGLWEDSQPLHGRGGASHVSSPSAPPQSYVKFGAPHHSVCSTKSQTTPFPQVPDFLPGWPRCSLPVLLSFQQQRVPYGLTARPMQWDALSRTQGYGIAASHELGQPVGGVGRAAPV